jgi:hypothetical protein
MMWAAVISGAETKVLLSHTEDGVRARAVEHIRAILTQDSTPESEALRDKSYDEMIADEDFAFQTGINAIEVVNAGAVAQSVVVRYLRRQDAQRTLDSLILSSDMFAQEDDVIVLLRDGVVTEARITRRGDINEWEVTLTSVGVQ